MVLFYPLGVGGAFSSSVRVVVLSPFLLLLMVALSLLLLVDGVFSPSPLVGSVAFSPGWHCLHRSPPPLGWWSSLFGRGGAVSLTLGKPITEVSEHPRERWLASHLLQRSLDASHGPLLLARHLHLRREEERWNRQHWKLMFSSGWTCFFGVVSSPRTCGTKKLVQEVQHFLLHDGGLLLGPFNFKSSLSRWYAALHSGRQSCRGFDRKSSLTRTRCLGL